MTQHQQTSEHRLLSGTSTTLTCSLLVAPVLSDALVTFSWIVSAAHSSTRRLEIGANGELLSMPSDAQLRAAGIATRVLPSLHSLSHLHKLDDYAKANGRLVASSSLQLAELAASDDVLSVECSARVKLVEQLAAQQVAGSARVSIRMLNGKLLWLRLCMLRRCCVT